MRRLSMLVGAVAALAVAGCGDDDDLPSAVDVVGVDFAFEGIPDRAATGVELSFRNDSDVEVHEIVAFRIPDDEDRSVEELLALPPEEVGAILGEVDSVIVAGPGDEGRVVAGRATLDEAGRYAIFCAIPVGADPAEYFEKVATSDGPPDVAGGPPHFVEGMQAELVVVDPD